MTYNKHKQELTTLHLQLIEALPTDRWVDAKELELTVLCASGQRISTTLRSALMAPYVEIKQGKRSRNEVNLYRRKPSA